MKNKVFAPALVLLMVTVSIAGAQNLPSNPGSTAGSIWTSPQSNTTEGRYRSNADDFIRPDAYTGVKVDKWFGMVSFLWNEKDKNTAIATAGFAANAGKLYIGGFYSGNFWANAPANSYTEQVFATAPSGGLPDTTYKVYNNISVVPDPVNNVALLFGIADMGIRLTYRTNHQMFNKSGIVYGNQLYNSYQTEGGYLAGQIAWGMAKDLTPNGLRPYVTADMVFIRDYEKMEASIADDDGNSGVKIERSLNHIDPLFTAGMGGYTFINRNGFKGSFDLDYGLSFNFYDNEYSYVNDGEYEYRIGKIKGTYSPGGVADYNEKSYMSHLLTPSLSGSWSREKLALKFKLNLPLALANEKAYSMVLDPNSGSLLYHGNHDTITTFSFRPDIRLALQYYIIPDRLTLNAGARIQATILSLKTTDRTYYTDGAAGLSQKIREDLFSDADPASAGGNTVFTSRFHLGLSFRLTENAWVEASTGIQKAFGEDAVEIFAPGGLFSFGSVLVGLKF